jgi:3-oxoacyl-[acyl-carrier protein] reductase
MLLKDKTVLITGASKGIGRATALLMAEEGAQLALISRDMGKLEELKKEIISKTSSTVHIFKADVRDRDTVKEVFRELNEKKIFIDVLVNNAGITTDAVLQVVKPEMIKDIFETNVFGAMYVTQQVITSMLKKRKGSVINISSIIGTNGNAGQTVYGSSKSAVIGFTLSLSKELAPLNIRVNAIAPGFINTDMIRNIPEKHFEKNLQ